MADIFDEVDEELKEENFKKLWDRYGQYVIAVVILIVLGTAAHVGWRKYTHERQIGYSKRFVSAMELAEDGKSEDAAAAFSVFAEDANAGYSMLARFREAAARRAAGDTVGAIGVYDTLAADSSIEQVYRDYATLLSVMTQSEAGDAAALSERLVPLAEAGPWRHTAREYLGLLALRQGDADAARMRFQSVADDLEAPPGARARAAELLQTLDQ